MKIEEIQDILAEIENRISTLENSQCVLSVDEIISKAKEEFLASLPKQEEWTKEQWNSVTQYKAMVNHLDNKLKEHLASTKRKRVSDKPF